MSLYKGDLDNNGTLIHQKTIYIHTSGEGQQERYSIDECFLDFTGTSYLYDDYLTLAKTMQKYINDNFGITVNIGIAENRLCAKMASDFEKPNKIHTLFRHEVVKKMWPLKVDDLFMIGRKSAVILHQLGIHTIGDLAHADSVLLSKYFKNQASRMIESAHGIDYSLVPIVLSWGCLVSARLLSKDSIEGGICDIEEANNSYLPSYLGYFFVALGVSDNVTLLLVFIILFIFSFHSQTVYFNPLFLLWGYKFYYIKLQDGRKIFVVTKREIVVNEGIVFKNLRRINYFTFIDMEKYK